MSFACEPDPSGEVLRSCLLTAATRRHIVFGPSTTQEDRVQFVRDQWLPRAADTRPSIPYSVLDQSLEGVHISTYLAEHQRSFTEVFALRGDHRFFCEIGRAEILQANVLRPPMTAHVFYEQWFATLAVSGDSNASHWRMISCQSVLYESAFRPCLINSFTDITRQLLYEVRSTTLPAVYQDVAMEFVDLFSSFPDEVNSLFPSAILSRQ